MQRYDRWARVVYLRFFCGKARKKQAIVVLAWELLVRCWAMLRDKARGCDETAESAAAVPL
jgi:hypothetical protein